MPNRFLLAKNLTVLLNINTLSESQNNISTFQIVKRVNIEAKKWIEGYGFFMN